MSEKKTNKKSLQKKPSLVVVCRLLVTKRDLFLRHEDQLWKTEFQKLVDDEEFDRLSEAKQAIESGYFAFLSNLCLVCWFLTREAEDVAHVKGMSKKEIAAMESEHRKQLAAIVYPSEAMRIEIEARADRDREWLPVRIRRTRHDTDLPTKQMIEDVMNGVFPEQKKWFPGGRNPSPTTTAKIWKDAGLSWVPKSATGTAHPKLKARISSLKNWIAENLQTT